jgi:hypothetical protein
MLYILLIELTKELEYKLKVTRYPKYNIIITKLFINTKQKNKVIT